MDHLVQKTHNLRQLKGVLRSGISFSLGSVKEPVTPYRRLSNWQKLDVFRHEPCFDDEEYEGLTSLLCWQRPQCRNYLFDSKERLQVMRKVSGTSNFTTFFICKLQLTKKYGQVFKKDLWLQRLLFRLSVFPAKKNFNFY